MADNVSMVGVGNLWKQDYDPDTFGRMEAAKAAGYHLFRKYNITKDGLTTFRICPVCNKPFQKSLARRFNNQHLCGSEQCILRSKRQARKRFDAKRNRPSLKKPKPEKPVQVERLWLDIPEAYHNPYPIGRKYYEKRNT